MYRIYLSVVCFLATTFSLLAQENVHFDASRNITRDSTVRVIDRNDISTQPELVATPVPTYKGVHDLIALPDSIRQEELLTLSFWIDEANTFTVTIGDANGAPIEVQKMGSLAKGAHHLSLEIGMLQLGEHTIDVRGLNDVFGKTKFVVIK